MYWFLRIYAVVHLGGAFIEATWRWLVHEGDKNELPDEDPCDPDLVDLAFDQAKVALVEQAGAVDRVRARSATMATAMVAVVGLLGASRGIPAGDDVWAKVSLGAVVAQVLLAGLVAMPRNLRFAADAEDLLVDPTWRGNESVKEFLAVQLGSWRKQNEKRVTLLNRLFVAQLLAAGIAVVGWATYLYSSRI